MSVQIIGMAEVLKAFDELKTGVPDSAGDGVNAVAKAAAEVIRAEAPQGPTGNLKKSIESGGYKKKQGKPVAAFVRVNRKKAPHAHLVEFGARAGAMPANPFFARGSAKVKGAALGKVEDAVSSAIDGIWK